MTQDDTYTREDLIYNRLVKKKRHAGWRAEKKGEKKYEAMKEKAGTNLFIGIYRFMVEELHLSGNRLFIYAAIYSFTRSGEGSFHGSRKYLARVCGACLSTVSKILSELLKEGLIQEIGVSEIGIKRYVANPKYFPSKSLSDTTDARATEVPEKSISEISSDISTEEQSASGANFSPPCSENQNTPSENRTTPYRNSEHPLPKIGHNKKDNNIDDNKEILNTASTAATAAFRVREKTRRNDLYDRILNEAPAMRHEVIGDEYDPAYYQTFKYYGIDKLVRLTDDQYYYLNEWLGEDILRDYINKLEHYLKDTPGAATRVHSHFKVLCKWLLDDLSLKKGR